MEHLFLKKDTEISEKSFKELLKESLDAAKNNNGCDHCQYNCSDACTDTCGVGCVGSCFTNAVY